MTVNAGNGNVGERSPNRVSPQFIPIIMLAIWGCASGCQGNPRLEYRIATIDGDPLEIPEDECRVEKGSTVMYRFPSGREVAVRVSNHAAFTFPLGQSTEVRLVDYTASRSPEMRAVRTWPARLSCP